MINESELTLVLTFKTKVIRLRTHTSEEAQYLLTGMRALASKVRKEKTYKPWVVSTSPLNRRLLNVTSPLLKTKN